jgi:Ca-activated chloride channel homolog
VTFAHPWLLLLLVVPLALVVWVWRRRSGALVLPLDHSPARQKRLLRVLVDVAETLPPLLLAVVLIVLANPQRLSEPRTQRVLTNIQFCVDISGSMTAPFGEGSRYDASMAAIESFLTFRKGDAFGLSFFGNNVLHWVPLTTDTSAIRCAPPFMRPENVPPWYGGTMIGKALLACRDVLTTRQEGDRMIILVSDGQSSDLAGGAAQDVAQRLRRDGIVVYHIHAAEGNVPDEVVDIAAITGGEAFAAADPEALHAVFKRIDAMQQVKLEKVSAETLDDYEPWCIAALSLLGAAALCAFMLRYTPW